MLQLLRTRLHQGHRTTEFPTKLPVLPDVYRGRPLFNPALCKVGCQEVCVNACPTGAIQMKGVPSLDVGKCLFCSACEDACPEGAIQYTSHFQMAVSSRNDLILTDSEYKLAERMADDLQRVLGRALRLREVCAGSCNACDLDTNVLNTVGWDLSRFGIQFVASPRHADGVLVTGPISRNMHHALVETYKAVPSPKIVIAVGACAISGGPFAGSPDVLDGVDIALSVDLYIPGCPPHPLTILDGLLRLIGRIRETRTQCL